MFLCVCVFRSVCANWFVKSALKRYFWIARIFISRGHRLHVRAEVLSSQFTDSEGIVVEAAAEAGEDYPSARFLVFGTKVLLMSDMSAFTFKHDVEALCSCARHVHLQYSNHDIIFAPNHDIVFEPYGVLYILMTCLC